jgi:hypothetical protein
LDAPFRCWTFQVTWSEVFEKQGRNGKGELRKMEEGRNKTPQDAEKSHGLANIVRMIILFAVLVGAWFLLDRLISGK